MAGREQIVLVNRPYPLLIKLSMSHIFCSTPGVRAFLMPKCAPKGRTSRAQANEAVKKSSCRGGPCGRPRATIPRLRDPYDATA